MILENLRVAAFLKNAQFAEALECAEKSLDSFVLLFKAAPTNWMSPPLLEMEARTLRNIAKESDIRAISSGGRPTKLALAENAIKKLISICVMDRKTELAQSKRFA